MTTFLRYKFSTLTLMDMMDNQTKIKLFKRISNNYSFAVYFCPFSFGHCVVCSSSIYGFWLPLLYINWLY